MGSALLFARVSSALELSRGRNFQFWPSFIILFGFELPLRRCAFPRLGWRVAVCNPHPFMQCAGFAHSVSALGTFVVFLLGLSNHRSPYLSPSFHNFIFTAVVFPFRSTLLDLCSRTLHHYQTLNFLIFSTRILCLVLMARAVHVLLTLRLILKRWGW